MHSKFREIKELSNILGITERAIQKWVSDGKIKEQFIHREPSSGRKGFKLFIDPAGLPQKKYRTRYKIHQAKNARINLGTDEFETQILAQLKPWQREKVLPYYTVIKKIEKYDLKGKKQIQAACDDFNQKHPDNPKVPLHYKSVYRVHKNYREGGIEAIVPKPPAHQGETKIPDDLYEAFEGLYLTQNKRSPQDCWSKTIGYALEHDRVIMENGTYYIVDPDTGEKLDSFPHYRTFKRQVEKRNKETEIILAREGERGLRKTDASYFLNRDLSNVGTGEVWVSDHRQMDVLVSSAKKDIKGFVKSLLYDNNLSESSKEELEETVRQAVAANFGNSRPARMWCSAWIDFKTGKWLSWYLHVDPPATDHVLLSFKWAVEKYGIPKDIIIDNGKDYRARDVAGGRRGKHTLEVDTLYTQGIMASLGIQEHFAIPYNARSKTIERQFRYIIESYEKDFPTYTGKDTSNRPEITTLNVKRGNIPTALEFIKGFDVFLENLNNQARGGREHDGHSPESLWQKTLCETRPLREGAVDQIAMRSSNIKELKGNGFYDPDLDEFYYNPEWVSGHVGERVYIRRDPERWDRAIVIRAKDEEILGEATIDLRAPGLARTEEEKAAFREKKAHQSELERLRKETIKDIKKIDWETAQEWYGNFIELQNDMIAYQKGGPQNGQAVINKMQNTPFDDIPEKLERMKRDGTTDLDMIVPDDSKTPTKLKGLLDD